jgi:AraC-like DNA-binding protein
MEILYQQLSKKSEVCINLLTVELPYFIVPWHYHNEVEIIYIEKGRGTRYVGDHSAPFTEGDVALIGPNLPHVWKNDLVYKNAENGLSVKALVVHFSENIFKGVLQGLREMGPVMNILEDAHRGVRLFGETQNRLATYIQDYIQSEGIGKLTGLIEILNIMCLSDEKELLASQGYAKIRSSADFDRFDKIHRYMIDNFHRDITLDEISGTAGMTPTSFCRYFKKRTTKSFLSFLNEIRIGHVCKLLLEGKMTINAIAYECGFRNISNFNYVFKQLKGITPSEYIKERMANT